MALQTASLDEIRKVSARLCRDYLTGRWKEVTPEQLIVKRISGGLSNLLYYVSLPDDGTDTDTNTNATGETDVTNGNLLGEGSSVNVVGAGGDLSSNSVNLSLNNAQKRQRTEYGENITSRASNIPIQQQPQQQLQEPREVLIRIYGQTHGEDALESVITESVVFALLSEWNFGPKLYGVFPGGRIEQYIQARPLATKELAIPKISKKVAEKMGEIHRLNIPMSKEPNWLWNCMDRWLKIIPSILNERDWGDKEPLAEIVRNFDFIAETKWLKKVINEGNYPVLFCHNDFQEGNILFCESETETQSVRDSLSSLRSNLEDSVLDDDTINIENEIPSDDSHISENINRHNNNTISSDNNATDFDLTQDTTLSTITTTDDTEPVLRVIDFEYCAYNYRGFDLANHFLEWTFDYTNPDFPNYYHFKEQYPTKQQRQNFIVVYLKKLNEHIEGYEPTLEEIESVQYEVQIFSLFSHLFWALWSVVMVTSNIEFGYWEYSITRIQEFKLQKDFYLTTKTTTPITPTTPTTTK